MLIRILSMLDRIQQKIYRISISSVFKHSKNICIHRSANISGINCIEIGDNFIAGEHLRLEAVTQYENTVFKPKIIIKDNVVLNDFVHIGATNYVEIGNNVLMASKIYISDHSHGNYSGDNQSAPDIPPALRVISNNSKVVIGDNVWIGEFVSILPGVNIGAGSIIGANSVVNKDIPPNSIAVGCPAKIIKKYSDETMKWEPVK